MDLIVKEIPASLEEISDEGKVRAYLTTFGNKDQVGDVIAKNALDQFVKDFDPDIEKLPMLFGHSTTQIVGEWKSLEVTDDGVIGEGEIYTETSLGKDVHALLKRKMLKAVSIGFKSNDYESLSNGGRQFNEIQLREASVVLNPCNLNAEVLSIKSAEGDLIEPSKLKTVLKQSGMSRKEVEALFAKGWSGLKELRGDVSEEVETKQEDIFNILAAFKF